MFSLGCTSDRIWNLHELIQYLAQNQNKTVDITIFPEAISLETIGLYDLLDAFDFEQVTIHTDNPLEQHDRYRIVPRGATWFDKTETVDPALHTWNQKKKFFCFYHRPTASRLGIAAHVQDRHSADAHIHFSADVDADNLVQFELDKLLSYDIASVKPAGALINTLPLLLSSPNRYTAFNGYYFDDPLTNFYQDILVDLVVESHVAGNTFFPTEKTIRPMWLKKPFIAFASRDYLCYLRQMGFMTFNEFWSEDYDGYEGRERYIRVLDLIDSLASRSHSKLNDLYHSMKHVLDHNYNLLLTQSYNNKIEKII